MARFGLVFLLAFGLILVQAMADKSEGIDQLNPVQGVLVREAEHSVSIAEEPSSESMEEAQVAEGPSIRRLGPAKSPKSDKSAVGGGVIIGGLVTTVFAAVFCYIRVTRKRGVVN